MADADTVGQLLEGEASCIPEFSHSISRHGLGLMVNPACWPEPNRHKRPLTIVPIRHNARRMKLTAWLKREGLSVEDGAVRIGCDRSTLARILPGRDGSQPRRRPSWKLLNKIVSATNGAVTANDFMDNDPEQDSAQENVLHTPNPSV